MSDGMGVATSIGGKVGDNVEGNKNNSLAMYSTAQSIDAQRRQLADVNAQLDMNADAIEALGIREAGEERLRGDVMLSNAKAAMAGSGMVTTDVGAVEQLARIRDRSDYNALGAIYESRVDASKERYQAGMNEVTRSELKRNKDFNRIKGVLGTDMTAMM